MPITTSKWSRRAARLATQLLQLPEDQANKPWLHDPHCMHVARLALIWADHRYSALSPSSPERTRGEADYSLLANLHSQDGRCIPKQPLDEHLLGVAKRGKFILRELPNLQAGLPHLGRHKGLTKRSVDRRYAWQDSATDTARSMRERAATQGAFIVNMASTGCGKTLANAKIMNALADPSKGLRCAFALGLRTLTLQTGRNYRDLLNLNEDSLAVSVGGAASRALFEYYESLAEEDGSASQQALFPEDSDAAVLFEGHKDHRLLPVSDQDQQARYMRSLIQAPVLVCTVDHLTPATESQRGGRQIGPMLRLMSSDLVLDELDDFDIADLPALSRLVYWAGLLGSRVLLSSATLPPSLVQGMFEAYLSGRRHFQDNRSERPNGPLQVCCGWIDEFDQRTQNCEQTDSFAAAHQRFAEARCRKLDQVARSEQRRRAKLARLCLPKGEDQQAQAFAQAVIEQAVGLHAAHHQLDEESGARVSFGLVRMANVEPIVRVARALLEAGAPPGHRIHLCVYHARFPMLVRSTIEHHLDAILQRAQEDPILQHPQVRSSLQGAEEPDQIFVVLGSPVTEVGRDHDYDWAVVEPSSMRSLIQLGGRVRRHRSGGCGEPNMAIFDRNLRSYSHPDKAAYCRPGFETDRDFRLTTHELQVLLRPHEFDPLDARPRMLEPETLTPTNKLVDLEHARLRQLFLPARGGRGAIPASMYWTSPIVHLAAEQQRQQPFRQQTYEEEILVWLPDEDEESLLLHKVRDARDFKRGARQQDVFIERADLEKRADLVVGPGISTWLQVDLMEELQHLAEVQGLPLRECAERYTTVRVVQSDNGWWFHPALGVARCK